MINIIDEQGGCGDEKRVTGNILYKM